MDWSTLPPGGRSGFDAVATWAQEPPYSEHLVADVGALNLALVAIMVSAGVTLEHRVVTSVLTGFAVYADRTSPTTCCISRDSRPVITAFGTGLGIGVALTMVLLCYAPYVRRRQVTVDQRAARAGVPQA